MKLFLTRSRRQMMPARRGMALVITLIMLSVTLVMAIAFLAVSNRERVSVTTAADQANARLAVDSALAAAQAQMLANVIGSGSGTLNFGMLVSTNYINPFGFVTGSASPTNVNYDYYHITPGALSSADQEINIGNLLYLPRAPVMISSNEPGGRFYLDLNRNGVFDDTSSNPSNSPAAASMFYVDSLGQTNSGVPNAQTGDPQWIGVLERPEVVHSPDNLFVYRYAFMAVPIGDALDLNYIYNQTKTEAVNPSFTSFATDGYFRNQGVGSWELNLAAFFTDLNTNQWDPVTIENNVNNPYNYSQWLTPNFPNTGAGFEDARALLSWRYNYNYNSLATANLVFPNSGIYPVSGIFPSDDIDEYGDGPLQTTTTNIFEASQQDATGQPWAGADSTNHFFNLPVDLFDPTKSSTAFTNRLINAGSYTAANGAHPTYDRYTFYRLMQQLGTDTLPDDVGKIDLNYSNAAATFNNGLLVNVTVTPGAQTNLVPWTPINFFTIAADRMLRTYTTNWFQSNPTNYLATYYGIVNYPFYIDPATGYGLTNSVLGTNTVPSFGITNIPVSIGGRLVYSPAVNRILQLAANIFDASTNNFYPSVFRPDYYRDPFTGNVFITGYESLLPVSGTADKQLTRLTTLAALPNGYTSSFQGNMFNVYGIPWIIGAKKNLPNFNQFYMMNTVQLTRKLQVVRKQVETWSRVSAQDFSTNQLFIMSITNQIGFSMWNSYQTNYPGGLPQVVVNDSIVVALSNSTYSAISAAVFPFATNFSGQWQGAGWDTTTQPASRSANANSFYYGNGTFAFLPPSAYQYAPPNFLPLSNVPTPSYNLSVLNTPNFPQTALLITNVLQAYILDGSHVIDYVEFSGPNSIRNLDDEIYDVTSVITNINEMWITNASAHNGMNQGVINQVQYSQTPPPLNSSTYGWNPPSQAAAAAGMPSSPQFEADYFRAFFTGSSFQENGQTFNNNDLTNQAPYTPTRTMYDLTLWQANDPLVHYLASDLTESNSYTGIHRTDDPTPIQGAVPTVLQNVIGHTSSGIGDDRYQPWGVASQFAALNNVDTNAYNLSYRDPLVYSSDYWDFPTGHYPTVGWLGRVHRGTPWQTVYLKAANVLALTGASPIVGPNTWMKWSANVNSFDATNSAPVQDTILFDIFTTALDDNASRGTLSVNQPHLAAWSAVLSGLNVVSNATDVPGFSSFPVQTNMVIGPAGIDTNSPVWRMYEGIAASRALYPNGAFLRPGDIVRVPALADNSPFLNTSDATHQQYDISDEMYEQIPQKILGLLRVGTPRYVVYCYGQALRPAQNGIALDSNHNGLVTNYQVVAESAARAVISVHPQVTMGVSSATGSYLPVTNYTTTVDSYNLLPPN